MGSIGWSLHRRLCLIDHGSVLPRCRCQHSSNCSAKTCLIDHWLDFGYSKQLFKVACTVVADPNCSEPVVSRYHQVETASPGEGNTTTINNVALQHHSHTTLCTLPTAQQLKCRLKASSDSNAEDVVECACTICEHATGPVRLMGVASKTAFLGTAYRKTSREAGKCPSKATRHGPEHQVVSPPSKIDLHGKQYI